MSFEAALANPTSVTELRFDFSEDGVLDGRVAALTELRELQLREVPPGLVLPEELLGLPKLRHLGLAGQNDRLVMPELVRRMHLEQLDLWDLDAADVPPMPSLRGLKIVVKNPREEVAIVAERFPRLAHLEVWGSHLERGELPDDIERFSDLEALYLVSCGISDLPAALAKLPALRTLGIRGCPMTKFPEVLLSMPRLETLELKAELAGLPAGLTQMTGLRRLDLAFSLNKGTMVSSFDETAKLKPLPRVLGEMTHLTHLDISCCGVTDFEVLRPLVELRSLRATWAAVESLAPLAGMTELEELSIEHCDRVKDLSPLAKLAKLRVLNLDRTEPRNLDVVRSLPALRELHIEGIETRSPDAIYSLDVELHADDEVLERYQARGALRGLPSLAELEQQLASQDASVVEVALDQLATWGAAASTRGANALVVLGIPAERDEDEPDDDDDEDEDSDDDDDDEDDDDDDDDDEGDEEGAMHAGPWLPAIDLALDRHLRSISPVVLARLFGTLFHDTGDNFHAAIRIANELVSRVGSTVDEAQCILVDGFVKANEFYDSGHREHGRGAHDTLIDQVFPLLGAAALTKLLTWASNSHLDEEQGDGLLGLFVPALERANTADRERLIDRLASYLDDAANYESGPRIVDGVWEMLAPIATGPLADLIAQMRGGLEAKLVVMRKREQLAARFAAKETVAAAIAEAATLPDSELQELQGGLWRANEWDLASGPRRQLFQLWQRRDHERGLVDAIAIAARAASVAELRADLDVLPPDREKRGKLLRDAVLEALDKELPADALERLRTLATEHDGKSRAAADTAEAIAVLYGAAAEWNFDDVAKGIQLLCAMQPLESPSTTDDEDEDNDTKPNPSALASCVASMAECQEFESLKLLARNLHKLKLTGRPLERILAQLVAVTIVDDDPDGHAALAPLIPAVIEWDILAYNLACKAARSGDRAGTLSFTKRALELGKSPDQFLGDSDFKAFAEDEAFVALLDSNR